MRDRLIERWQGVALTLLGVVSTVWLGATGRLGLYIHPRYFVFTMVLAVLAGIIVIAAFAIVPTARPGEDGHDHGDHGDDDEDGDHLHAGDAGEIVVPRRGRLRRRLAAAGGIAIVVAATVALIIIPPATLTTATASSRSVNSGSSGALAGSESPGGADLDAAVASGADAELTVKDWSTLIRQGASVDFLADKTASVSGFVTPDASDPENVFYIARFVVTCCAVDAQPVGLAVHMPGWQDEYAVDSWVEASGGFVVNPSISSDELIVLDPATIAPIDEPAMPYVY